MHSKRTSCEKAQDRINHALDRVGRGEIGIITVNLLANSKVASSPRMPSYLDLFHIWDYARGVRAAFMDSIDVESCQLLGT